MIKSWILLAALAAWSWLVPSRTAAQSRPPQGSPAAELPAVTDPDAPPESSEPSAAKTTPKGFRGWWRDERTGPAKPVPEDGWVKGCIACDVPFTGEKYRTRGPAAWFRRTASDWLAMPSTVVTWGAGDWLTFGGFTAATIVPMLPLEPSLDVRVQDWVRDHHSERADKAFVHITTKQIVSGIIVYEGVMLAAGWASGNERLLEYASLSIEAIADVQFYHLLSKLLLGREGPKNGDGQGKVHGPTEFFFPAGTPSGHTATLYAMLTVAAEYADSWPLRIFSHVASLYFGASLVYHNTHFFSDVIWGAAMGYYMGRWIMHYRSSRYSCDSPKDLSLRERIQWMPVVNRHGAMLGASLTL